VAQKSDAQTRSSTQQMDTAESSFGAAAHYALYTVHIGSSSTGPLCKVLIIPPCYFNCTDVHLCYGWVLQCVVAACNQRLIGT
jgi:hypothetical protein